MKATGGPSGAPVAVATQWCDEAPLAENMRLYPNLTTAMLEADARRRIENATPAQRELAELAWQMLKQRQANRDLSKQIAKLSVFHRPRRKRPGQ